MIVFCLYVIAVQKYLMKFSIIFIPLRRHCKFDTLYDAFTVLEIKLSQFSSDYLMD